MSSSFVLRQVIEVTTILNFVFHSLACYFVLLSHRYGTLEKSIVCFCLGVLFF